LSRLLYYLAAATSLAPDGNLYTVMAGGMTSNTFSTAAKSAIIDMFNHTSQTTLLDIASLSMPRSHARPVVVFPDMILFLGGANGSSNASSRVDAFNLTTMTVQFTFELLSPRRYFAACLLGPYIYMAGGQIQPSGPNVKTSSVQVIDIRDWSQAWVGNLSDPVDYLPGGCTTGAAYFLGGVLSSGVQSNSMHAYFCGNLVSDPGEECDSFAPDCVLCQLLPSPPTSTAVPSSGATSAGTPTPAGTTIIINNTLVAGSLLIAGSVDLQAQLTLLPGATLTVQGAFTLSSTSVLVISSSGSSAPPLQVSGCAELGGSLVLEGGPSSSTNNLTILNASCISGQFLNVTVAEPCTRATLSTSSSMGPQFLIVTFDLFSPACGAPDMPKPFLSTLLCFLFALTVLSSILDSASRALLSRSACGNLFSAILLPHCGRLSACRSGGHAPRETTSRECDRTPG